jgi:hypothetical protein
MLDPEVYDPGNGEGGSGGKTSPLSSAGKTASGGSPAGHAGTGATIAGSSGTGASSGVDPSLAIAPCRNYCPGYGAECKKRLKGQDCLPTCQGELNNFGPVCQALGVNALTCLAPFFSAKGGNCDAAVNRALTQCGPVVTAFEDCKKPFSGSPSMPSSNPVSSCKRSGNPSPTSCAESFSCASGGDYVTFCSPTPQSTMVLDCGCVTPTGQMASGRLPASSDPCLNATTLCQ